MRRLLTAAVLVFALGGTALASPAGASSPAHHARHHRVKAHVVALHVRVRSLPAAGGAVTVRARLRTTTGRCTWSVRPKVAVHAATSRCRRRMAHVVRLPANLSQAPKRYVVRLARHKRPKQVARAVVLVAPTPIAAPRQVASGVALVTSTETSTAASAPSAPASTPTTTIAPAATEPPKLVAHVDPSFTQAAADPLDVTFAYSADASETTSKGGTVDLAEEGELPDGILDLYSDGLLECSMSVGGSKSSGNCEVNYASTGDHKVITTYVAGSTTATETDIATVEPYSTTLTLAWAWVPDGGYGDGYSSQLTASVTDENGNAVPISTGDITWQLVGPDGVVRETSTSDTGATCVTPVEDTSSPNDNYEALLCNAAPWYDEGSSDEGFTVEATFNGLPGYAASGPISS